MKFRSLSATLIALGIVAGTGCASQDASSENVNVDVEKGPIAPQDMSLGTYKNFTADSYCSGTVSQSNTNRAIGESLAGKVFGKAYTLPTTTACNNLGSALTDLRNAINNGSVRITSGATHQCQGIDPQCSTCGVAIANISGSSITGPNSLVGGIAKRIKDNTPGCKGGGVLPYLMPTWSYYVQDGTLDVVSQMSPGEATLFLDPEPATLTADLVATQGAAASAYFTYTGGPTTAKKWIDSNYSCGTKVAANDVCSLTSLSTGQQAFGRIYQTASYCKCYVAPPP